MSVDFKIIDSKFKEKIKEKIDYYINNNSEYLKDFKDLHKKYKDLDVGAIYCGKDEIKKCYENYNSYYNNNNNTDSKNSFENGDYLYDIKIFDSIYNQIKSKDFKDFLEKFIDYLGSPSTKPLTEDYIKYMIKNPFILKKEDCDIIRFKKMTEESKEYYIQNSIKSYEINFIKEIYKKL